MPADRARQNTTESPASSISPATTTDPAQGVRKFKRIRTRRACDECRSKKIRCEYAAGREAVGSCAHCDIHGLDCTTIAPAATKAPRYRESRPLSRAPISTSTEPIELEPRFYGGTSIPGLVAALPSQDGDGAGEAERALRAFHSEHDYFSFATQSTGEQFVLATVDIDDHPQIHPRSPPKYSSTEVRVASQLVSESVLESLVALYRMRLVPIFPVVTISETASLFPWIRVPDINSTPPSPLPRLLRLVVCAVPAQWRSVPRDIRQSLRLTLASQLDGMAGLGLTRASSLGNLQTMLVLSMSTEVLETSRRESWLNVGLAIRMGQEIGLHRAIPGDAIPMGQQNRRKRVWAACQIADAWYAVANGLPLAIDPNECDIGPPQPYPDHCASEGDPCFSTHVLIWRISLILNRIVKAVCSPKGLENTTDAVLYQIERDIGDWESKLPSAAEAPVFESFDPGNVNILKLVSVSVEAILVRALLKPTSPIPPHITFRPSPVRWERLVQRSGESIEWISQSGMFYLDVWHVVIYSLTLCSLIQLQTYLDTGDKTAHTRLKLAQSVVEAWAAASDGELPHNRSKVAAQLGILVKAADSARPRASPQGASMPGGGVNEAEGHSGQALYAFDTGSLDAASIQSILGLFGNTPPAGNGQSGPSVQQTGGSQPQYDLGSGSQWEPMMEGSAGGLQDTWQGVIHDVWHQNGLQ
ncbi:hypothetical protein IAT38_000784 [Cryptococcus sp. DSM 104549]